MYTRFINGLTTPDVLARPCFTSSCLTVLCITVALLSGCQTLPLDSKSSAKTSVNAVKNKDTVQTDPFSIQESRRIVQALASDEMNGRGVYSKDIIRATEFIEAEFAKLGLGYFLHLPSYRYPFVKKGYQMNNVIGVIEGKSRADEFVVFSAHYDHLGRVGSKSSEVEEKHRPHYEEEKNPISTNTSLTAQLLQTLKEGKTTEEPLNINALNINGLKEIKSLANKKPPQTLSQPDKDLIYNGANDNASGVTALIQLARYFKQQDNNERTLIFIAFTGEEQGLYGSNKVAGMLSIKQLEQIVAMINIDMIGTQSQWGTNSAYITGYDKSDVGKLLNTELLDKQVDFKFYADPYTKESLFYRSDNRQFAYEGVPAHTIMTTNILTDTDYHQVSDEISLIDFDNLQSVIQAIALSSENIIKGTHTPKRIRDFWSD